MAVADDQQFCLRWNNFQANITSQFETLRDDEDFTDVTIACEGQRLQAHKVVLSACSPFFKELFKSNPCPHPIIFMRDVEARHVVALMEFMYAGEVNIAQTHLSAFLKTAESLKIRGLTDSSPGSDFQKEDNALFLNPQPSSSKLHSSSPNTHTKQRPSSSRISSSSTVSSSQDNSGLSPASPCSSPPSKRQCRSETEPYRVRQTSTPTDEDALTVNPFALQTEDRSPIEFGGRIMQPKVETPEYLSDDDVKEYGSSSYFDVSDVTTLSGGMEIIPQSSNLTTKEANLDASSGTDSRKLHSLDPRPCRECGRVYSNLSNLRQHIKLIHNPTYVQCAICKKSFKTDLYLKRHILNSHDSANLRCNLNPTDKMENEIEHVVQNTQRGNEFQYNLKSGT